jgi:predicted ATPase/DNA-binding CsgD family transcriptional regulator/DNA-binding XRE family transcriptional regulator
MMIEADRNPDSRPFGSVLREVRIAAGLTQEDLAERTGLSVRGISDLERGARSHPHFETVRLLADALELTLPERTALVAAARPPLIEPPTDAAHPIAVISSLPTPPTRLVGRDQEVALALSLFDHGDLRLLTLTGPGGVGKTRLAIEIASQSMRADQAVFVDLAAIADPELVAPSIARAMCLDDPGGRGPVDLLKLALSTNHPFLVLDNFEQVVEARSLVSELLSACPGLKILVTSRTPLRLHGEQEFPVPPLEKPIDADQSTLDDLEKSPAVKLFVLRARAADPHFTLNAENAPSVIEVCNRVEGLPLAIELAAARVRLLPPEVVLKEMDELLPLLSRGPWDAPDRQKTMESTIAWSYGLLSADEQTLFRRLGVFVGGFSLPVAEAFAAIFDPKNGVNSDSSSSSEPATTVFENILSLVEQSLIRSVPGPDVEAPRFGMYETVREYAVVRLIASGEVDEARRSHAAVHLELAQRGFLELRGTGSAIWIQRLEAEKDNFRAALSWAVESEGPTNETALRLASELWLFWKRLGYVHEARNWLERALAFSGKTISLPRADALLFLGHSIEDDQEKARECYEQSRELYRRLGARRHEAGALSCLGMQEGKMGNYSQSLAFQRRSLALFEQYGRLDDIAQAHFQLGTLASIIEDYDLAKRHLDEARSLYQHLGWQDELAYALQEIGRVAGLQERYGEAENLLRWSYETLRTTRNRDGQSYVLCELGDVAFYRGDFNAAAQHYRTTLDLLHGSSFHYPAIVQAIEGLARVAVSQKMFEFGLTLWAAATAWRDATSNAPPATTVRARTRDRSEADRALGFESSENTWMTAYHLMSVEEAVESASMFALPQLIEARADAPPSPEGGILPLTQRQRQVLCLIACGLKNKQIADRLDIGLRTVTTHVTSIFTALDIDNRAAAAAFALRAGFCSGEIEAEQSTISG